MTSPSTKVALRALEMRGNCFTCERWRIGQTIFNACHSLFPEIADSLRGNEYDPFYDDTRVEAFLQQVEEKLSASSNG